ncbi:VanW family protein [Paenibacillus thiaminolyticus]|uniref:VanW family protein n=1 Tax=Paenibacillus thiaminolyticus TaxID=49283 RepID=UPI003D28A1C0
MKKIHALFIVAASLLLAVTALWGLANSYASQDRLPPEVRLSSWEVGGMSFAAFREELDQRLRQLEATPVEVTFGSSGVAPVKTTLSALGVTYDAKPLLAAMKPLQEGSLWERIMARRSFNKEWDLQFHWKANVWKERFTPGWETASFGKPVNASREITKDDQVVYTPERQVYRVDRMQLEQLIRAAIPPVWYEGGAIRIEAPLVLTDPPVTVASLKAEGIERKIIEYSTGFAKSEDGRTHNVVSAAQTIDDMILKPGDIFDYDKVIAETEKKYGFKEAPVIYNGKLVPGIGGGICQVSSTLYNAVLRTGLEIVERRNHSLPVSYLPLGLDATFSQGYINFKFKNSTGKHLLIRTETADGRLTIKFFGTMDNNLSYQMETKTVKVLDPQVKYVKNPNLPAGTEQVLQQGKKGYVVESYRIKMVDGNEVERERIAMDTYQPQPSLIAVNNGSGTVPAKPKTEKEPIVEDGINGPDFKPNT